MGYTLENKDTGDVLQLSYPTKYLAEAPYGRYRIVTARLKPNGSST